MATPRDGAWGYRSAGSQRCATTTPPSRRPRTAACPTSRAKPGADGSTRSGFGGCGRASAERLQRALADHLGQPAPARAHDAVLRLEVHADEPELRRVAVGPLVVVEQRP